MGNPLKIKTGKKIPLEIDGDLYEMLEPTAEIMVDYNKEIKNVEEGEQIFCLRNFLIKIGLPEEITKQLSVANLNEVVQYVAKEIEVKK